jgi:hypothetical protein
MFRKLLLVLVGCLVSATAMGAACRGKACAYAYFGKDSDGCLEIRNGGRDDIQVTVYTAGSGAITVRIASGDTEKVYKTGRTCVPAADYVRADAEFDGGVFAPPR